MADVLDNDILRGIWKGLVTIGVAIDKSDLINPSNPPPIFYNSFRRVSYFPIELEEVVKYYLPYTSINILDNNTLSVDFWVSFNGLPLKWHLPIGVLYDLFGSNTDSDIWKITLHFNNFPSNEVIKFNSVDELESAYMSNVKESDYLLHDMASMNRLELVEQKRLFSYTLNDNFEQFLAIKQVFLQQPFKQIPFRLYQNCATYQQSLITFDNGSPPVSDNNNNGELLFSDFVKRLPLKSTPTLLSEEVTFSYPRFIIHGIDIPKNVTMAWLYRHLSYPDGFLHVVVRE